MGHVLEVNFREEATLRGTRVGKPQTAYHEIMVTGAEYVEPTDTAGGRIIVACKVVRSQITNGLVDYNSVGAEFNHTIWMGFLNPEVELARLMSMSWIKGKAEAEKALLDQESDLKTCLWALGHDAAHLKEGKVRLEVPELFIERKGVMFYEASVPKVEDPQEASDWTRTYQSWVDPAKAEEALLGKVRAPKLYNAGKDARTKGSSATGSAGVGNMGSGQGLGAKTLGATPATPTGGGLQAKSLTGAPVPENNGQAASTLSGLGLN